MPKLETLLSATQLARLADVSVPTVLTLYRDGTINADAISRNEILFKESRLSELKNAINNKTGLGRAIAANIAKQKAKGK